MEKLLTAEALNQKIYFHKLSAAQADDRLIYARPEHPDWEIYGLSEEHGHVRAPPGSGEPKIGELVTVIPNHACVVTNLFDRIYAARQGRVETFYEVAARGKVQ